jgi:hypothetical protein
MNFAKNTVCMQCDAKRPKRQLLPGEWECPRYLSNQQQITNTFVMHGMDNNVWLYLCQV